MACSKTHLVSKKCINSKLSMINDDYSWQNNHRLSINNRMRKTSSKLINIFYY